MAEFELIKKALLIGLGAAAVSVDKAQDLVQDLVKRGQITQAEATQLSTDLKSRALKEKDLLEARVTELVETTLANAIKRLGLVTQKDLAGMKSGAAPKPAPSAGNQPSTKKPHRKTPKPGAPKASAKKPTAKKPASTKPTAKKK